jgi:hypothetical protein
MTTLIHIYNTTEGPRRARGITSPVKRRSATTLESLQRKSEKDTLKISELQEEVRKHKMAQKKLKMLTQWNLRSTESSLKDVRDILHILEELYGEFSYEEL